MMKNNAKQIDEVVKFFLQGADEKLIKEQLPHAVLSPENFVVIPCVFHNGEYRISYFMKNLHHFEVFDDIFANSEENVLTNAVIRDIINVVLFGDVDGYEFTMKMSYMFSCWIKDQMEILNLDIKGKIEDRKKIVEVCMRNNAYMPQIIKTQSDGSLEVSWYWYGSGYEHWLFDGLVNTSKIINLFNGTINENKTIATIKINNVEEFVNAVFMISDTLSQ
jgi:hypothetical protein